jgi:tetratricopeptide (TPR) repeat protein
MILRIARDFRTFERPVQLALLLGVVLLVVTGIFVFVLPQDIRLAACFGALGLTVVMQAAVLYAYRGMVTPLGRARQEYLNGRYEAVIATLRPVYEAGKADFKTLVLLGNAARQAGDLEFSKTILYEALNNSPEHHFALYGIGRTLLAEGQYADAAQVFSRARSAGAPAGTALDLAEASFRAGDAAGAAAALKEVPELETLAEPYRAWLLALLRLRLAHETPPETAFEGEPYWRAAAMQFNGTPYGQSLLLDIADMRRAHER